MGHDKISHSPFKFNSHWLEHEDLVILLKNTWKVFYENFTLSPASQFHANLKLIKNVAICWSVKRKEQDTKDLVEIEVLLLDACTKLVLVMLMMRIRLLYMCWNLEGEKIC